MQYNWIVPDSILESYLEYRGEPTVEAAHDLLQAILEYDFNHPIQSGQGVCPPTNNTYVESHLLSSSGSTRDKRNRYSFGPYSAFWLCGFEFHIKNPEGRNCINLCTMPRVKPGKSIKPFPITEHYLYNYVSNGNWYGKTLSLIQELEKHPRGSLIISDPKVFLYLLKDESFIEAAIGNEWELSSTGSSPLYPSTCHVNDNMIDWRTGLNFYTCKFGHKHFLPMFSRCGKIAMNLANLASPPGIIQDQFKIDPETHLCPCGRRNQKIDFIPHLSTSILNNQGEIVWEPSIADKLEDQYIVLQFVQEDDIIKVLYTNRNCSTICYNDRDTVAEFLTNKGLPNFEFHRNRLLFTSLNEKTEAFYRNVLRRPIEPFPEFWKPPKQKFYIL